MKLGGLLRMTNRVKMLNKLRLGSIQFINSLPVDLGILSGAVAADAQITQSTPSALNQKILQGELEVSPVSAFWYAKHHKELLLFPDLSISSESGVQSVLLFSRCPIKDLKGKKIGLTGKGRTTPVLLEILCRSKYGFAPQFAGCGSFLPGVPEDLDAVLLIGDEALLAKRHWKEGSWGAFDLAREWRDWTGLPIVFAVWAVRRDVFLFWPEKIAALHKALLKSKAWGAGHPGEVIQKAQEKTELPREILTAYFSGLSFDFDEKLKSGMRRFFKEASRCGLLSGAPEIEEIKEVLTTS